MLIKESRVQTALRAVRQVRVALPLTLMDEWLRGQVRVGANLPSDVRYLGGMADPLSSCINLFYEHESFDPVPEGEIIPWVTLWLERAGGGI